MIGWGNRDGEFVVAWWVYVLAVIEPLFSYIFLKRPWNGVWMAPGLGLIGYLVEGPNGREGGGRSRIRHGRPERDDDERDRALRRGFITFGVVLGLAILSDWVAIRLPWVFAEDDY